MALADYRLCDKCGEKTFYDAKLNYDYDDDSGDITLEWLGDWAVICKDCASKYRVVIVDNQAESEGQ